jgi:quercetin dioxygenase-like cupin family protein
MSAPLRGLWNTGGQRRQKAEKGRNYAGSIGSGIIIFFAMATDIPARINSGGRISVGRTDREEIKGKVISLKDLVAYQDGSIASRMIINTKSGSITIFSFDKDEGISEHTAPFDAVVTILDGACEIRISGITYPMKEGETIIMPAGAPHALTATSPFKMILVMIKE